MLFELSFSSWSLPLTCSFKFNLIFFSFFKNKIVSFIYFTLSVFIVLDLCKELINKIKINPTDHYLMKMIMTVPDVMNARFRYQLRIRCPSPQPLGHVPLKRKQFYCFVCHGIALFHTSEIR